MIKQLNELTSKYLCPLFVPGDVFTRWDSSAYLISWLLASLNRGPIYTIPGNHDTPNHDPKSLKRSAYWTMVQAGRFSHLPAGETYDLGAWLQVSSFPFGHSGIKPPTRSCGLLLSVALIHAYVWTAGKGFTGADPKYRLGEWLPKLKGYDCAFFGDNHTGFLYQDVKLKPSATNKGTRPCTVGNCGSLQRLTTLERCYRTRVYLLHANGMVSPHYLGTSGEKWSDADPSVEKLEQATGLDLAGFVEELNKLRDAGHDFRRVVQSKLDAMDLTPEVKDVVMRAVSLKAKKP